MKRTTKKFIAVSMVLGAIFCVSLFSFAEDGKKDMHEKDRIVKMKEKLGLSDDQVIKIKAIFTDSKKTVEPLKKQHEADMKALKAKVKAGAADSELKLLLDALQLDNQKIMDARKTVMEQVKAILTPLQQAKEVIGERSEKDRDKGDKKEKDGGEEEDND